MEPGRFQVLPSLLKQRCGALWNRRVVAADQSIDVENPEPDPLEVESRNGSGKRLTLFNNGGRLWPLVTPQQREQIRDPRRCGLSLINSHRQKCTSRRALSTQGRLPERPADEEWTKPIEIK